MLTGDPVKDLALREKAHRDDTVRVRSGVHAVSRGPAPKGIESGFAPTEPEVGRWHYLVLDPPLWELSRWERFRLRLRDGQTGASE